MDEKTVEISKKEYESLLETSAHMNVLEAMGVDNWIGYVGPYNDCGECGEGTLSWALDKCPECGEELEEAHDLI